MAGPTRITRAAVAGCSATMLLDPAAHSARADAGPSPASVAAAHGAATASATVDTLARFFAASDGSVTESTLHARVDNGTTGPAVVQVESPLHARVDDDTVPVCYLAPDFVAGRKDAPVARLEFLAPAGPVSSG